MDVSELIESFVRDYMENRRIDFEINHKTRGTYRDGTINKTGGEKIVEGTVAGYGFWGIYTGSGKGLNYLQIRLDPQGYHRLEYNFKGTWTYVKREGGNEVARISLKNLKLEEKLISTLGEIGKRFEDIVKDETVKRSSDF